MRRQDKWAIMVALLSITFFSCGGTIDPTQDPETDTGIDAGTEACPPRADCIDPDQDGWDLETEDGTELEIELPAECPPVDFPTDGADIECSNWEDQFVGDHCIIEWYTDPTWGCMANCSDFWGPTGDIPFTNVSPDLLETICRW